MALFMQPVSSGFLKFRVHCAFARYHSFNVLSIPPPPLLSFEDDFLHSTPQMNLLHTVRSDSIISYFEGFTSLPLTARSDSWAVCTPGCILLCSILLCFCAGDLTWTFHMLGKPFMTRLYFQPIAYYFVQSFSFYIYHYLLLCCPDFIFPAQIWAVLQVVSVLFSCCLDILLFLFPDLWSSQSEYYLLCT